MLHFLDLYMKTFLGYIHSFTTEHIVYSFLYHHLLLYFIEIVVPRGQIPKWWRVNTAVHWKAGSVANPTEVFGKRFGPRWFRCFESGMFLPCMVGILIIMVSLSIARFHDLYKFIVLTPFSLLLCSCLLLFHLGTWITFSVMNQLVEIMEWFWPFIYWENSRAFTKFSNCLLRSMMSSPLV